MKPLACYTYIKGNKRKVLPSFICTIISVFLVYLFGLLLYGSIEDFNKTSINLVDKGTFIRANNIDKPIGDKIISKIQKDPNVSEVLPMIGYNNSFSYVAPFGNSGTSSFIFYSEDVKQVLKNLKLELVEGTIPKNNSNELLMPIELVKQYKLKLGDYLNNKTNENMQLNNTYKLVGITKGDVILPIVCDVGTTKRDIALKYGLFFFFKDCSNKSLNDRLIALKDKTIVILEYNSEKGEMDQIASGIDFMYIAIDIIILLVLCLSLGNLNYIIFLNRKKEFAILDAIGFSKGKLRRKLFKENTLVCLVGFLVGIAFTTLVAIMLNVVIWNPDGKNIAIFRASSMMVAFIIPVAVAIISMISSVREFNKLSYESLSA
jgi:putative ABC transport system permease protein